MKKYWLYIVLLAAVFGLLLYSQANTPREEDWRPSFSRYDKIPYGSYALYALLQQSWGKDRLETTDTPLYSLLSEFEEEDDTGYNLVMIGSSFNPGKTDTRKLLDFVARGNNVFASALFFSNGWLDTLKIQVRDSGIIMQHQDSLPLGFVNPEVQQGKKYLYEAGLSYQYFDADTDNVTCLGYNGINKPDFIRIKWGNGNVFLHNAPLVFTNFELLQRTNWEYAFKALSYLPDHYTLWDEYDKPFPGGVNAGPENASPLAAILDSDALSSAYYLLVLSLLVYIIFEGKRKQRIIPVIPPLKNSTVEFVETVGRLYFENRNHRNLAEKKISHFYDFLRQRLYLRFTQPDERLYRQISTKAAMPIEEVQAIFWQIDKVMHSVSITEEELISLNNKIDHFYKRFNG